MNAIKKHFFSLSFGVLSLFFISGVPKKKTVNIVSATYDIGFSLPLLSQMDSAIYVCTERIVETSSDSEDRISCTCYKTLTRLLKYEIIAYVKPISISMGESNTIIIWDKNFITNYILPLFKKEEDRQKIEYTLANSNDSTFTSENVIDYDNKVIVNDKMYYYPFKIKQAASVIVTNIPQFYSIISKSSWIFYGQDCFDDKDPMWINLLIPLLEMPYK